MVPLLMVLPAWPPFTAPPAPALLPAPFRPELLHAKLIRPAMNAAATHVELTRFGGRFRYAAFFTECISSNSIGLL